MMTVVSIWTGSYGCSTLKHLLTIVHEVFSTASSTALDRVVELLDIRLSKARPVKLPEIIDAPFVIAL
jgi:hypothetical protein